MKEYFYNESVMERPGFYHKEDEFHFLNYRYEKLKTPSFTSEACHLPMGGNVLSIFVAKDVSLIENTIVFYWLGDERNIHVVRRIIPDLTNPVIYNFSVPFIAKVTEHKKDHPNEQLPPVFDSQYGRAFVENKYIPFAEAGFDRKVKRVFQFQRDGNRIATRSMGLTYKWQPFLVEFHNGEIVMAFSNLDHQAYGHENDRIIHTTLPYNDEKGKTIPLDFMRACVAKEMWFLIEHGIDTKREVKKPTWRERLREWWNNQ